MLFELGEVKNGKASHYSYYSFDCRSVMCFIVVLSTIFKINPDNVATPIAASLGDLVTLSLLASIGQGLYFVKNMVREEV